jgi:type I pantothenate kinase
VPVHHRFGFVRPRSHQLDCAVERHDLQIMSGDEAADPQGRVRVGALTTLLGAPVFNGSGITPYVELDREQWASLAKATPLPMTEQELERISGLGDPIDLAEVDTIYRPLSRLLNLYVAGTGELHNVTSTFLGEQVSRTPFVIGVAGSVAVGKSTTARVLKEMLARWPDTPRVELVTTDGFLYPNAVLQERGLMARKGFPESYDRRALLRFVAEVKSGAAEVRAPRYSHLTYDILPDDEVVVHRPDVLIVEGLNVLQPARLDDEGRSALAVSDFFDFSIYVDAETPDIKRWYTDRFLSFRHGAFSDPDSFFAQFAVVSDEKAVELAGQFWDSINAPNLIENILPTRGRANLVLTKGPNHAVTKVRLRKL